ncbi:MAG: hypothetical protein C0518_00580 [Opitutus sp.]|nr:hypothetical protein [Opitutus sp.]
MQQMTRPSQAIPSPYLSVVAASRNDDHGGDPLTRTQIFINCFAQQCEKYQLPAELILVDWNPVPGRPGLAGVLQLPANSTYCRGRVVTVPAVLHDRFAHADRLPFFQMIAKNVGIRRAKGDFILATNIDIVFSDELIRFIACRNLDHRRMLRVDRYDIHRDIPLSYSVEQTLEYAWINPVRANRRLGLRALIAKFYGTEIFARRCHGEPNDCAALDHFKLTTENGELALCAQGPAPIDDLHTNACGDFTLLPRAGWEAITGYAEFASYSFNIDSLGLGAAHYAGYEEIALLPPCVCFHIEHSLGSGWTPEGETKLFERLRERGIPSPDWSVVNALLESMRLGELPAALNGPTWGLAEFDLPDEPLLPGRLGSQALHPQPYETREDRPVSALRPEFNLELLTLWQKRHTGRLNKQLEESRSALEQAEFYLREVEKDRDDRLAAILAGQDALAQTIEYLRKVEKDRDDRLASITFYQDKLKSAYSDHEHNVAYIGRLHEEIAEHVKVSADKDQIIAQLNAEIARLQTAAAQPPPTTG